MLAYCNHIVHRRARRGRRIKDRGVVMEAEGPDDTIAGFEDGGKILNQKECRYLWSPGKARLSP